MGQYVQTELKFFISVLKLKVKFKQKLVVFLLSEEKKLHLSEFRSELQLLEKSLVDLAVSKVCSVSM